MPTALELSSEQMQRYVKAARRRSARLMLTAEEQALRQALLERVIQAAQLLKSKYGAKRVFLFGSLAHQAWFNPVSDVDLAVEGLRSEDYWRAWRDVEQIITDREVDLIELETASVSLKRAINRYGMEL